METAVDFPVKHPDIPDSNGNNSSFSS